MARKGKHDIRDETVWQAIHITCMVAHGGMLIAAFAVFVANGISNTSSVSDGNTEDFNKMVAFVALPWTTAAIATIGVGQNLAMYRDLRKVQKHIASAESSTQKQRYWLAVLLNAVQAIADVAVCGPMIALAKDAGVLGAVIALAFIAGIVASVTLWMDLRNFQDIRQKHQLEKKGDGGQTEHALEMGEP